MGCDGASMSSRSALGRVGEQMAVRHLERAGLLIVARNWRPGPGPVRGELDVVARDGHVLVICEVKARRGDGAGGPFAGVTPVKLARLRRLGAAYLAEAGGGVAEVRIDVVGVTWPSGGGRAVVEHLMGVS